MKDRNLSRRDVHKLTLAALGGMVAGSLFKGGTLLAAEGEADNPMLKEPHVCCGLNTCKGHGQGGENACGGQGQCATAEAHACGGQNACGGQGGCGESVGSNACKGQGNCAVPLSGDKWQAARSKFEAAMEAAGKQVGAAPEACGGSA